jgi:dihydroorotate dehydrogenase
MSGYSGRIGRMEISSPWGNAGGVIKTVEEFEMMARTGVGWLEPGSYTLEKRFGNQKDEFGNLKIDSRTNEPVIVYHHDPISGETTNSLGMPNQGRDQLVTEVPEMLKIARTLEKEVVFNVAPVTEDPVTEVQELVSSLIAVGAKHILINLGCPNVLGADGQPHGTLSHHPPVVGEVLKGLRPILEKYPDVDIYVRTSPDEELDRARQTYHQIIGSGVVRAAWVHNTWPLDQSKPSPLGVKGGGRSGNGPELAAAADRQLALALETFRPAHIDVVMSTGIRSGQRLKQVLELGAVAGAGTTFFYEAGESWGEATDMLIRRFMETEAA